MESHKNVIAAYTDVSKTLNNCSISNISFTPPKYEFNETRGGRYIECTTV